MNRSWGLAKELVSMLNKDYLPCLGVLFKSDVESAMSTFLHQKQHLDMLNQDPVQESGHAVPLILAEDVAGNS